MRPGPRAVAGTTGEPEVIGFVNEREFARGFVRALAQACRTGVPVELRAGMRAYVGHSGPRFVDEAAAARKRLLEDIEANERQRTNALEAVLAARAPSVVQAMVQAAESALAAVARLTEQLALMDAEPHDAVVSREGFDASADVLTEAMRGLVRAPRMTRLEHDNFRRVVPQLRVWPTVDGWGAEAYVRILVADGLAVLGPITWTVVTDRAGMGAMRSNLRDRPLPAQQSPAQVESMLVHEANLSAPAAHVLARAPFPELAQLVLHSTSGRDLPNWVEEQWREPAFVEHVLEVYASRQFERSQNYGRLRHVAQGVVDCTAAAGLLTLSEFRRSYPGASAGDLWPLARPESRDATSHGRRPPVRLVTDAEGARALASVMCQCGLPATTMARGPEIPGALLCSCGRAPFAERGSTASKVIFPPIYQRVRVSREAAQRALCRRLGGRADALTTLPPKERNVLRVLLTDPARVWGVDQVADYTGDSRKSARLQLERLVRRDYAHVDQSGYVLVDILDARNVLARRSPGEG